MRNLKLKQVLPVDNTETLQKVAETPGLQEVTETAGLQRVAETAGLQQVTDTPGLHKVKETPGLHVMGDLYDCECEDRYLLDSRLLTEHCLRLVAEAELTVVGNYFHQFDGGGGVTGMIVLAESHMSIHTWPEKRYVTVDVYVCSYTQDNRPKARRLYESLLKTFKPAHENVHSVERL